MPEDATPPPATADPKPRDPKPGSPSGVRRVVAWVLLVGLAAYLLVWGGLWLRDWREEQRLDAELSAPAPGARGSESDPEETDRPAVRRRPQPLSGPKLEPVMYLEGH